MPSAFSHDYFLYPTSTTPRRFQSLTVEVDPMLDSQRTAPSGSAYPSWSSVTGTYTMMTATGPLDMGDMIYGLASMFWYKNTSGLWEFTDWAGAVSTTGWRAPLTFDKVIKYANDANGETGEIQDPILNQLGVQIMGEGNSQQTQTWFGKRYTGITKPSAPAIPASIFPWIRRNADWVVELSADGYGGLDNSAATLLSWDFTMPEFNRRIFDLSNNTAGNTGYDTTVRRRVEPTVDLKFLADQEWTSFFSDADDAEYFIKIKSHDDEIAWTHRCKLTSIPTSFQDDDDAHVITSQFVPVARSLPEISGTSTQAITAQQGTGGELDQIGFFSTRGSRGARAGYTPPGIDALYYDAGDDEIVIGPLDIFGDLIPSEVTIGTTNFTLAADRPNNVLTATGITTAPFAAGAVVATFQYDWLPNDFVKISIDNSPVTQWW